MSKFIDTGYSMEFVWSDGLEIHHMRNPMNGQFVELSPPLKISDQERMDNFRSIFEDWCTALWRLGHVEPKILEVPHGWVHADPIVEDVVPTPVSPEEERLRERLSEWLDEYTEWSSGESVPKPPPLETLLFSE